MQLRRQFDTMLVSSSKHLLVFYIFFWRAVSLDLMHQRFFLYCRFTFARLWRVDRNGLTATCLLTVIAAALAIAAFSAFRVEQGILVRLSGLSAGSNHVSVSTAKFKDSHVELDSFDSGVLLGALNGAATLVALPVNELVFRLDDNPARPYLRYTATVKVFGDYPAVRKFVDAVRKPLPQTSLDALSCTRTDIQSVHLSCELTLSAFYRRAPGA